MNTYTFDGSFDGLLTGVFTAFVRHERPAQLIRAGAQATLFTEEGLEITTDTAMSDRVWNGLRRKLPPGELNALAASFLCDDEDSDSALFRVICRIFDEGAHAMRDFGSPDTLALLNNARKVSHEAHRVLQFMRFQKAADGTFLGIMEPAYDVMPQVMEHFSDRFANSRFIIYDQLRQYGFSYDHGEVRRIRLPLVERYADGRLPEGMADPEEKFYQQLWRTYFNAIAIPERRNPRKQRQDMPVRFWKFLTEKQR